MTSITAHRVTPLFRPAYSHLCSPLLQEGQRLNADTYRPARCGADSDQAAAVPLRAACSALRRQGFGVPRLLLQRPLTGEHSVRGHRASAPNAARRSAPVPATIRCRSAISSPNAVATASPSTPMSCAACCGASGHRPGPRRMTRSRRARPACTIPTSSTPSSTRIGTGATWPLEIPATTGSSGTWPPCRRSRCPRSRPTPSPTDSVRTTRTSTQHSSPLSSKSGAGRYRAQRAAGGAS